MENSFQYLNYLTDTISKTTRHLHDKRLTSIQYFSIGLLERLSKSAISLKLLLTNLEDQKALEYSIGVILRSSILDTLIVYNFYKHLLEAEDGNRTQTEKEDIIKPFCDLVLSDGLSQTLKYVKMANQMNVISNESLLNVYHNLTTNLSGFFEKYENDGSEPILLHKKPLSPTSLFRTIANTPGLKDYTAIYDLYLFFSKYDHYGIMYFELSKQSFEEKMSRIYAAVELLIAPCAMLHMALKMYSPKDILLTKQCNISAKYLHDHIYLPLLEKDNET